MVSWFRKSNTVHNQENEPRTSHQRPLPTDVHDEVATERTRLLGQRIEAEVAPSPYNLVVVRSILYISTPRLDLFNCRYISDPRYRGVVDCSIRLGICKCPRIVYSGKWISRPCIRIYHKLCPHQFHYILRHSTSPRCSRIIPHTQ